jgi:hypothetical protein
MSSKKQIAANRRNAKLSTGPRTPEGKAKTRFNALKHGIYAGEQVMFGETEEALEHLTAEYHEQYQPTNPTERFLLDTIINNEWRLRRLRCAEAELWKHESDALFKKTGDVTAGQTFAHGLKTFSNIQRVINSCERNLHRALKELQRLRSGPPSDAKTIQPQPDPPQPVDCQATSEEVAFFPQNPPAVPNPFPPSQPNTPSALPGAA